MTKLDATALIVTHRRPRLATETVRMLLEDEGFEPADVVLVVNGEGGLVDDSLERSLDVVRLEQNVGPAGGFRVGLQRVRDAHHKPWVYVCEDDITLFDLDSPRVSDLISRLEEAGLMSGLGAVVAYGRKLDRQTGLSFPYLAETSGRFEEVDVAAWGATLVSRKVLDRGVFPDADLFFGFEDFDFFLSIQSAGFKVMVDGEASVQLQDRVFFEAKDRHQRRSRPVDSEEAWRRYYAARNFIELARRHGDVRWHLWHLAKSLRRLQLLGPSGRKAYLAGIWDGALGRKGRNDAYLPTIGEYDT